VQARRLAICFVIAAVAAAGAMAAPAHAQTPPWRAAEQIRTGLVDAQSELILGSRSRAQASIRRATAAYDALAGPISRADRSADAAAVRALAAARRAIDAGSQVRLAAARGAMRAALFRGAYAVAVAAAGRGDATRARRWLLVREFRTATRFTRPGADATLAITTLGTGATSPAAARRAVMKDLLDAYQARLRELLDDAARGAERALPNRRAEAATQAAGYFAILARRYREDRGPGAEARATAAFAKLARAAVGGASQQQFERALAAARRTQQGFTAAPLTSEEAGRRAQQLLQFLALIPIEYGRGVSDERVTLDFEIQEAVAFHGGATAALADLGDQLAKRAPERVEAARADLARLGAILDNATKRPDAVAPEDEVEQITARTETALKDAMPDPWLEETDESVYDVIALTLDRMEAAVGAGEYGQAEQARLEAYAFFEFGPERRLQAFDPGLVLAVEGLVWFGAAGKPGLAKLIADRAPRRDIRETRLALDEKLANAAATLGDSANKATVVTNSAIIVFREGLEAVLILAAITASFVGIRRRLRRPVLIGAGLGLAVSLVTWGLAQTLLGSLHQYGERLEAVVGLIAIGVLLIITNWFFHRVYWSEWIGKFHRRRKRLESLDNARFGFLSAQAIGLGLLGLTSVYREGFETVLFLQSLELSAGTATVVQGAGLGLAMTLAVAVVTFTLQRKLPYKKMLIVTGALIGFVLVVMVGQTARTMQGTGWLEITPVGGEFPYWLGLWFGVYPTWETLGAQIAAAAFVIGSYLLAQEVRVKRPQRRARRGAPGPVLQPSAAVANGSTNGHGAPSGPHASNGHGAPNGHVPGPPSHAPERPARTRT
jgi:high-affinity iron transporter